MDDEFEASWAAENLDELTGKRVVQFYVQAPADRPVPRTWKKLKALLQKPFVAARTSERSRSDSINMQSVSMMPKVIAGGR